VIPAIVTQALVKETVRLGSLETRRDFTYVSDTVRGFLRAGEAQGVEGQVFNLGTGEEVTIADLACRIVRMVGRPVQTELDPERLRPEASEVMRLLSDPSLAGERLGWRAEVPLDEGLALTVAWIREHLDLYQVGRYEF
jgi:dTDP-glucose 4,6-dehydratase